MVTTEMVLPNLTPEQRQAARDRALAARRIRAEVKQRLRQATTSLEEVLAQAKVDDAIAKLRVIDVLQSIKGIGQVRAKAIMDKLDIADSRRLRGLGSKQIAALLEEFGRRD